MNEPILMKFSDLALGARFKYLGYEQVWIKINDEDCGLIAEYNSEYIRHTRWIGQRICSFSDTPEQLKELDVVLVE
jgi:hypothetical protein